MNGLFHAVPEMPNNLTIIDQSVNQIEMRWLQTGIVTNYSIVVLNEVDNGYTVKWFNETASNSFNATINNLLVSGRTYDINLTAISEDQYSEIAAISASTRKIHTIIVVLRKLSL